MCALAALVLVWPSGLSAQGSVEDLMAAVMPQATRFGARGGSPPVVEAFGPGPDGAESLIGYVFLTSDQPPERRGYSGPIEALVGMDLSGTLTGMRVIDYYESHRRTLGDFLRRSGFQEQYAGKTLTDAFSVNRDVDGISRATITVRALSRGVRDAARRVADAYLDIEEEAIDEGVDPSTLTWLELVRAGFVQQIALSDASGTAEVSVIHVGSPTLGEFVLGSDTYERAQQSIERRGGSEHLFVYGVDGDRLRLFQREGWSVIQEGDTLGLDVDDVYSLGLPNDGVMDGQVVLIGAMIVDSIVDVARPLTLRFDPGGGGDVHELPYRTVEAREAEAAAPVLAGSGSPTLDPESPAPGEMAPADSALSESEPPSAESPTPAAATVVPGGADPPTAPPEDRDTGAAEAGTDVGDAGVAGAASEPGAPNDPPEPDAAGAPVPEDAVALEQSFDELLASESSGPVLSDLWSEASWGRVGAMVGVLLLAFAAFWTRSAWLRAAALSVTLLYLGFTDGGFLSITHVTSAIWVGPSAFVSDLPLLLIATFTVVTTLLWGRVFCGYLCPFGALQDAIDWIVPRRLQRELPPGWHRRALKWKYVVLGIILVPALAGSHAAIYPYFEPFGTVFFLGTQPILWAIAAAFLLASVVIPRFYCRYACPLGAALAVGSLVAIRRIPRVEQCDHCKVCERACPTGAIDRASIDFKECVRCSVCEVKLREQAGVCQHDMETVRSRLVQIERRGAGAAGDV